MAALTGLRTGRLRLGIIQASAGVVDLVLLLRAFRERYPAIELRVRSGPSRDMATGVLHGELDAAIVALPGTELPPGLTHHPIVDDPLVAVLSHAAAAGATDPIGFAELVERGPLIHFLPGSGIRTAVEGALERAQVAADDAYEIDEVSDMIRLAAAGVGVTVVPATTAGRIAGEHGPEAPFAVLALADTGAVHPVGVVYDAERLPPAAAAFLDTLPVRRTD